MIIQLLSDLHFEFFKADTVHLGRIQIDPRADVVVMAGDIDQGIYALKRANDIAMHCGKPVIFVPGNHEFYHMDIKETLKQFRKGIYGVHVLLGVEFPDIQPHEKSVEINGVRFCGGTLWTDFKLYQGSIRLPTQNQAIEIGQRALNDFRVIRNGNEIFTASESVRYHEGAYRMINEVLDTPFNGKTVMVTHHGVHNSSIHPKYSPGLYALDSKKVLPGENTNWMSNPAFSSHLPEIIQKADLCLHGHTHESLDYLVGNTRVVTNPRGYPINMYGNLRWENSFYEPQKLIVI